MGLPAILYVCLPSKGAAGDAASPGECLDPTITAFNATDVCPADHIKRVLQTFLSVFTGIGEFSDPRGGVATSTTRRRILDFAREAGLALVLHTEADMPFAKPDQEPTCAELLRTQR